MKKLVLILLSFLFLLFNVNAVSASLIDYSFSISVQTVSGDPLNLDGGTVDLTFRLDTDATADEETHIVDEVVESVYYDVSSCLTMTQSDGTVIYSESVLGDAYVNDSYSQTNIVDSVGWYVEDLSIGSNTYRISLFAGFEWDFISTYPDYPTPFPFDNSDVIWHGLTIFTTENGIPQDWVYHNGDEELSVASGTPVPEPSTLLLLGTGLVGLVGFRRSFKA